MSLFDLQRLEQIAQETPVDRMNHLSKRFGFSPAPGASLRFPNLNRYKVSRTYRWLQIGKGMG